MSDPFWTNVNNQLDHIEEVKPNTASHVVDIMNTYSSPSSGAAFFEGSGGGRQLFDSLWRAGWRTKKFVAEYYWVAQHSDTGEQLTYVEGDVFTGDTMISEDD